MYRKAVINQKTTGPEFVLFHEWIVLHNDETYALVERSNGEMAKIHYINIKFVPDNLHYELSKLNFLLETQTIDNILANFNPSKGL